MIITIDNFDGAGARDYTAYACAENLPTITRKLNQPSASILALVADDPAFVIPASGGRIKITRTDGVSLFTGYLTAAPELEYMGEGQRGPAYRYRLAAQSDEWPLDRQLLPNRAAFVMRTAGAMVRQLTQDAGGTALDVTGVDSIEAQPAYNATPQLRWAQHAAQLALLSRAAYRAHDGKIIFKAIGAPVQTLNESDVNASPAALRLRSPDSLANDVTILGLNEPRAYAKNYFLGDGLTSSFYLSHTPFTRFISTIAEEEFKDGPLDPTLWSVTDPSSAFSTGSGKLNIHGGTGVDGQTVLQFVEQIQMAGSVRLQHGQLEFSAAGNGVIGGIYSGSIAQTDCVAGFKLTPSGSVTSISAFINGAATGTPITSVAGHKYALTTRIYCSEAFRSEQQFHSSAHAGGSARGGTTIAATVRAVLEVHDIDPANPATLAAPSTILYDGAVTAAPGYCIYAPANILSANCTLSFIEMSRGLDALIRNTIPGFATATRLAGNVADGAECSVSQTGTLRFFSPYVPVSNETIEVTFRTTARALARVQDSASIAAKGMRSAVHRIQQPAVRDSTDCENAALALLDDSTQLALAGEYQAIADFMPGGASVDHWPGDCWTIVAPSRGVNAPVVLRSVELRVLSLFDDRSLYTLAFANDAAASLSFEFTAGILNQVLDPVIPAATGSSSFIASLPEAAMTGLTSTTMSIDAGIAPPAGGGIEVRSSDFAWSPEGDTNLIGRFATQSFTVPRLARSQTVYVRQYDASSPRKYSRYSTVLHIDYPF
jgi:hypothetical protein